MSNYKYYLLYLKNAWSCLHAMLSQSTVIYRSSLDQLFSEQLVELTAILDSFHKVANTTVKTLETENLTSLLPFVSEIVCCDRLYCTCHEVYSSPHKRTMEKHLL